ncbi:DUF349 domain-containing protein [Flavobacteriaceae bacterium F08102]|nr:DUF349 domain-containing protein [Flavobacteriaceae bacterium F08102]
MLDDNQHNSDAQTPSENQSQAANSASTPESNSDVNSNEALSAKSVINTESNTANEESEVSSPEVPSTPQNNSEPETKSIESTEAEPVVDESSRADEEEVDSSSTEEKVGKVEAAAKSDEISSIPEESVNEKPKVETNTVTTKAEEDNQIDYSALTLEQLITHFQKEIKGEIPKIKKNIEEIKSNFTKKFEKLRQEKKEAFLEQGGNEVDFEYVNPLKTTFNDLLFEYKTKRERYYSEIEREQKENLKKRLALIEELKHLIDNAEPETMYTEFRALEKKWKEIGKIPRVKYNDVWRTYHHHVERFYDLLHLRNDFRDLDFKHNLEEKLKLVEKAEQLAEQENLNEAFKELQVLHKIWKEDIGPVAREYREEIWERFSNATKKIHERRHELQKELESKFEANAALKREVIAKISAMVNEQAKESHKYWQQKIKELEALRQEFFAIGKVPRAMSDQIWNEFKSITREFNRRKNVFYKNIKREQLSNLEKKRALVNKAEELKESEDWEVTTEIMKHIQAEWKQIGHVPRKYSDKLWNQFKGACNYFFDRLHKEEDEGSKEQIEAFNKKKEMLERLKESDEEMTLEQINALTNEWRAIGQLPQKMRHLEAKFSKVINGMYSKMDLNAQEIAMLKFRNLIDSYLAENNYRKIDNEKVFVRKKIDEISKEIQQLETNVGFFSNADENNPLFKGVNDTIKKHNEELEIWKNKQDYLASLDY